MKKILALLLAICMVAALFVGCAKDEKETEAPETEAATEAKTEAATEAETEAATEAETEAEPEVNADYRVAMITDYGDITDQSFNQTTYEAGKEWCEANGLDFTYYKPTGDSTAERVASMEQAIEEGYNVLLMPGFAFAEAIIETVEDYPEVKYIALDVGEFDLQNAAGCADDFSYVYPENLYSAVYQEELCGFMAGYAAVKLGYRHLGYLGGMAVPAVVRYGYGYVQGADAAAKELGCTGDVTIEYVYGNQFFGDADITAYMETIYGQGTEVVFACGGGIFTSAGEAAVKTEGKKVIGVDVDQAALINAMFETEGLVVTSAMKGLAETVKTVLNALVNEDRWADFGGKVDTLGLVSEVPSENYVQLGTTQFGEGFTEDDYNALVAKMFNGEIKVDNNADPETHPETEITVNYLGNIK